MDAPDPAGDWWQAVAAGEPNPDGEPGLDDSAAEDEAVEGEVIIAEEDGDTTPTVEQTSYEEGGTPGTDNEEWRLKEKQYTPERLVRNAKADLGSDKWAPKQINGKTYNQCNIFVADELKKSNASVPNVGGTAGTLGAENSDMLNAYTGGRIGGQPPSANDWYKGKVPGYEEVNIKDGEIPRPGDIAASESHVGIVSGAGKTISVTTANPEAPEYGRVIENEWGFRKSQEGKVSFWRIKQ